MGTLYRIALVLVIIGAVNWGLIGFFEFDLVAYLFGGQTATLSRWVYALVGIAGLVSIPILMKPMEDAEANVANTEPVYRNPNYQMEMGEEADFKKSSDNNNSDKKDS